MQQTKPVKSDTKWKFRAFFMAVSQGASVGLRFASQAKGVGRDLLTELQRLRADEVPLGHGRGARRTWLPARARESWGWSPSPAKDINTPS